MRKETASKRISVGRVELGRSVMLILASWRAQILFFFLVFSVARSYFCQIYLWLFARSLAKTGSHFGVGVEGRINLDRVRGES